MERIEKDSEIEERILMEIIVDAHDSEEQVMGWYYYLADTLGFPFVAVCGENRQISPLKIGEKVKMGETIALAGRIDTMGGHYGDQGHSHLHLTTFVSPTNEYRAMKVFIPMNGQWVDPLSIFFGKTLDSHSNRSLPEKDKNVIIPYIQNRK